AVVVLGSQACHAGAILTYQDRLKQRQEETPMAKLDRTKTNIAIERLLAVRENPRPRLLRMAYYRHRFLEIAGRYEEICVPEMMVEDPVYHVRALGITATQEGQEAVKGLCSMWTQTSPSIFYIDDEQVAVDNCI